MKTRSARWALTLLAGLGVLAPWSAGAAWGVGDHIDDEKDRGKRDGCQAASGGMPVSKEVPAPEAKKQEESAAPPESAPEATDRAEAAPKAEPELAAKAAAIIREHPDGVSLAEMGKSLGVSWQTLIGVARELVETKQAKKADSKYYPR